MTEPARRPRAASGDANDSIAGLDVPAVIMRGGTSKGVFLHVGDVPAPGPRRDAMLLQIMGSPDPMQIDGLGGTHSSTSKVILVGPGLEPGIDVSYWFAQVGIADATVDWSGNCGNLTTAVGPFAIDQGIVEPVEPVTTVRLRNENTGVRVIATVPVSGGKARTDGDLTVSGVPNSGAPIETRYLDPVGGALGPRGALPTGSATDLVTISGGDVAVSIVNVTHPYAFTLASAIGLTATDADPRELNRDKRLLARLEQLRGACAVLLGTANRWDAAARQAPTLPRLILVAESPETEESSDRANVLALGVSMGSVHHALPMTGALCLGAAIHMPGTIPASVSTPPPSDGRVRIRHPKGDVIVTADVDPGPPLRVGSVGVVRTARRLMSGTVHLRHAP